MEIILSPYPLHELEVITKREEQWGNSNIPIIENASLNCLHFLKHEMKQWNKVQYKIQTSCPDVMKSLKCLGEVIFLLNVL